MVTYETKPSNGHRVFFDTTLPTVELNGYQTITLQAGIDRYVEQYATVNDNIDGFISDKYEPTIINYYADPKSNTVTKSRLSKVNMKEPGLYKIGYVYTDKAGNKKQATRFVYVQDTTKPIVTLNGDRTINLTLGETYDEKKLGAKVTDNVKIDYSRLSVVINYYAPGATKPTESRLDEVDTFREGTYKISYKYVDPSGNESDTETRVVTITAQE